MNLPEKIPVGGIEYDVEICSHEDEDSPFLSEGNIGRILFNETRIALSEMLSQPQLELTTIHEALHGIGVALDVYGEEVCFDEHFIVILSYYVHQLVKAFIEAQDEDVVDVAELTREIYKTTYCGR